MAGSLIGMKRRTVLIGGAGLATLAMPFLARAGAPDVHIGVVDSLSGPWAYNGGAGLEGAKMAVEEINAGGGIRALGGARLKLDVVDAGKNPDEARSAAQRLLAGEPTLVGGMGAFLLVGPVVEPEKARDRIRSRAAGACLILLCHKVMRRVVCWQQGQRGSVRAMARAIATRTDVMEFAM